MSIRPGAIVLTVIPSGPISRASVFSQPTTPGPHGVRERQVRDRLLHRRRLDRDDAAAAARPQVGKAERDEPDMGDEQELDRRHDGGGVDGRGGTGRWAAAVEDEDVDAAERLDGGRHEPLEIGGLGQVALDGERADPRRFALDDVAAAGEHRHVRPFGGERLGDREAHALRGAEHDGAASLKSEVHGARSVPGRTVHVAQRNIKKQRQGCLPCSFGRHPLSVVTSLPGCYSTVSTETTSRTAASDTFSIFFSAAVSFSLTTSSAPPAPSRTGTPM